MNVKRKNPARSLFMMVLLSVFSLSNYAQGTITGTVTQKSDGTTLPGVSVLVKGTSVGTITNLDGQYSIQADDDATLVFSFVGYLAQEIAVGGQSVINVGMEEDVVALGEFVAIGYGTQRKKDVSTAMSSVSSEDFEVQPIREVDQILQGRSSGVTVTKSSGAPGGTAKIRIRGSNSIYLSNDPLYVIDGLVGADFSSISPNDIDDMQILKDASATAIYGSRGANGVVIITTKGGKRGEAKINFRANYSVSERLKSWDLLDAGQYAETTNAYNTALGVTPVFTEAEVDSFKVHGGTDWQDEVFRLAQGQDYQLTVSGGNDRSTYFVSGNFYDQEGIVINSGFKRYALRTNVSSSLTDNLKANFRTNFTRRESLNNGGGGGKRGTLIQMLAWAPTTSPYDEDGNITIKDPVGSIWENPLESAYNEYSGSSNVFTANGNIVYTILPGLSIDVGLGARYGSSASNSFTQGLLNGYPGEQTASASRGGGENYYLANTNILTYKRVFNRDHNLTITAVNEQTTSNWTSFNTSATKLLYPVFGYNNLSLLVADVLDEEGNILTPGGEVTSTANYGEGHLQSFLGRANYIFKDRYFITASVRRDGSSAFQKGNNWATFPSFSAAWDVSQEEFLDVSSIDQLKLRASWGLTGNQNVGFAKTVGAFKTSPAKDISTSFTNGESVTGIILGDPGNVDLKWETTEQFNIGFDLTLWSGRMNLNADYFKKQTYDLLLPMPVPSYLGGGSIFQNVGEVRNEGFEFSIGGDVVKSGDFTWNTSFNATFLDNEVVKLGRGDIFDNTFGGEEGNEIVIREGEALSSFYGLTYLGTWKDNEAEEAALYGNVPGDAKFLDLENDFEVDDNGEFVLDTDGNKIPVYAIDSKDKSVIGSSIPKGSFGWNNTFSYKNWTLNIFFQAMTDFDRLNLTYANNVTQGRGSNSVRHADILDRYIAPTLDADGNIIDAGNTSSDIPQFSSTTRVDLLSSRFVEDASFIRLKNISLSYELPLKGGRSMTFMAAATNVLTFTNYRGLDPEAFTNRSGSDAISGVDLGAYPNSKMYSLGLSLNF